MNVDDHAKSKVCKGCGVLFPFSEFGKEAKGKFGLKSKCRKCIADKNRNYAAGAGSEMISASQQRYREKHKDELRLKTKNAREAVKREAMTPEQLAHHKALQQLGEEMRLNRARIAARRLNGEE
ncbi:hypothetical protein [Providencia rettgeri]|uniref:hypothetical protein n=1 Tax=Providencia rettgeri TaxID=587 RepID=UPI0011844E38|nr:hypothetical protein [Providencia rettgeri]